MSSANFYLNSNDRAPEVSIYNHNWANWIRLNTDTRNVPSGARAWKDIEMINWATVEMTPSGKYTELEWTKQRDWYRHNTHWRSFGPTHKDTPHSVESPWYSDMDTPVAYSAVLGGYSFTDLQWGNVTNKLIFLDSCLKEVVSTKQFLAGHGCKTMPCILD